MQAVRTVLKSMLVALMLGSSFPVLVYGEKPVAVDPIAQKRMSACEAMAQLKDVKVMEGSFLQEKILPVFKKPLISTGHFLSVKGHGLLWNVEKPVPVRMVFTPGMIKQYTNNGVKELNTTGTAYDGIAILLPALFDNDLSRLEEYFIVSGEKDGDCWKLFLKPKGSKLEKVITSVLISGTGQIIQKAVLHGADKDVTNITFNGIRVSNNKPTQEKLAWFL